MNKQPKIVTIGGGVAGLETSAALAGLGYDVTLFEKEGETGGKLNSWSHLFPNMADAPELAEKLREKCSKPGLAVETNTEIGSIRKQNGHFLLEAGNKKEYRADAIVIATGFNFFNARRKEEYGYGIYDNVLTSVDLEQIFRSGEKITTAEGKTPKRIAFIHCVGSRDEKSGNHYCSKVCCITGVKQAISLKEALPDAEIYCFYMDLRLVGLEHEALYREAQEKYGIQFIRGRLSEASENMDKTLLVKAEDTLSGRPLKMNVDLLVLLVGMEPGPGSEKAPELFNLLKEKNGFLSTASPHTGRNFSSAEGIFLAGTCCGPMSVAESAEHARSAALEIHTYLQSKMQAIQPDSERIETENVWFKL